MGGPQLNNKKKITPSDRKVFIEKTQLNASEGKNKLAARTIRDAVVGLKTDPTGFGKTSPTRKRIDAGMKRNSKRSTKLQLKANKQERLNTSKARTRHPTATGAIKKKKR